MQREWAVLDRLVGLLGLDPFTYVVLTIVGISVWVWCTVIGDFATTGRGLCVRRLALLVAAAGAVLFWYGARRLG
jgi:hypothetical protein